MPVAPHVAKMIEAAGDRAGLPHLHPHMLRHTCGHLLADAGHDTRRLQLWLGHSDIKSRSRSRTRCSPDMASPRPSISRRARASAATTASPPAASPKYFFAPHADLLHGHDGGMNKTGTMDGIWTLAGYADTSSHGRVRFVISLISNDDEMRFRLLRAIDSGL
jgi:hypothetical protein